VVEKCDVLEDDGEVVLRDVKFKDGENNKHSNFVMNHAHVGGRWRGRNGSSSRANNARAYYTHQTHIGTRFSDSPLVFENTNYLQATAGSGIEIFQATKSASKVLNIVSTGTTENELYLTFTFEWEHEEIQHGSEEEKTKQKQYQETAPRGVQKTLDVMREMVKDGKL
jgi:hypothetical protein